jgi:hypothetical protein
VKRPKGYDYLYNIHEIQAALDEGDSRIVDAHCYMADCFFPDAPSFGDDLSSSYAMPSESPELDSQYQEELKAIWENIQKHSPDIGLDPSEEVMTRFRASMTLQSTSMNIWDTFALPLRLHDGRVYRIWGSKDLMGTPVVKSMPVDSFLRSVAIKTAEDKAHIDKLNSRLGLCVTALVIIITVFGFWLL